MTAAAEKKKEQKKKKKKKKKEEGGDRRGRESESFVFNLNVEKNARGKQERTAGQWRIQRAFQQQALDCNILCLLASTQTGQAAKAPLKVELSKERTTHRESERGRGKRERGKVRDGSLFSCGQTDKAISHAQRLRLKLI